MSHGTGVGQARARRLATRSAVFSVVMLALAVPHADTQTPADREADTQALILRLMADRAAILARDRGLAEAAKLEALAKKEKQLRRAKRMTRRVRTQLRRVDKQRKQLITQVTALDRKLAAEIAVYRAAVTKLARSPNPRKRKALEQYANGQRKQAYAVLHDLASANQQARKKAADIASAAELRELMPLAQDMKDRGDKTTTEVIAEYEAIVALDSGVVWDWIWLARLYDEAGRLDRARQAARKATDLAWADVRADARSAQHRRNLAVSLGVMGDVERASGDLAGARKHFEESLAIARKLSRSNPSSAAARRRVSVSLHQLGDVERDSGDLAGARKHFEESLAIDRELSRSNPSSAAARRDVSVSLERLGHVLATSGDLAEARKHFEESLAISRVSCRGRTRVRRRPGAACP